MDIAVGDKVQIVNGAMDVTNGLTAKGGKMYGEGGPLWATVSQVVTDWNTGNKFGLPTTVTKIRCEAGGVVVWQVQPKDIASNIIKASNPDLVQTQPDPPSSSDDSGSNNYFADNHSASLSADVSNTSANPVAGTGTPMTAELKSKLIESSPFDIGPVVTYVPVDPLTKEEKASIGPAANSQVQSYKAKYSTAWSESSKRKVLLNEDIPNHQNAEGFPYTNSSMASSGFTPRRYDFQIMPNDSRYTLSKKLEDLLRDFRATAGIPVHGDDRIARQMKYFLYNRFKVPDINLAHNRSFTHVFFTRPDLNILRGKEAHEQCINNSESALVWYRFPELFRLLVDADKLGDDNNFNLLLSNQVTSFDMKDEELEYQDVGKSWREHSIPYGTFYAGRNSGEFSCNFTETADYSVINLIKLWITYIDNVASGAWSPSYEGNSHVFSKTLDYASSAYVFKCGPDGESILYWSKYYGIFPLNTGAGALSWDLESPVGNTPKLNIRFRYAFKKDMSPLSLTEFNDIAKVKGGSEVDSTFNPNLNQTGRPFVGCPFIEIEDGTPDVDTPDYKSTILRLKFKPANASHIHKSGLDDNSLENLLYRYRYK